jgi:hypothetical protein
MNRIRKPYTLSDMLRILMLGAGVFVVVLAGFSIGLLSLQGTVDLQNNPRIDVLIVGIFILALFTVLNLRARSPARRSDLKK